MNNVYQDLYRDVFAETTALRKKIRIQEASGIPATVIQEETLKTLERTMDDITKRLPGYKAAAQDVITKGQQDIIGAANNGTEAVVNTLTPDSVDVEQVFARLNDEQLVNLLGAIDAGPLAETLAAMPNNVGQSLANFLISNAVGQYNPRQLAARFAKQFADITRQRAEVIARTELIRAAREAQRSVYEQNDIVMGYERQAAQDGRVCLGCLTLSGHVYSKSEIMPSHPMCRCVMLPVLPEPSWFINQDEKPVPKYTAIGPVELMAGMDDDEIRAIFGPTRYKRYKEGNLSLEAMVGVTDNPRWGPQVNIKPLRDVDGTVTLPPNGNLHIPVRRPDLLGPPIPPTPPVAPPPVVPPKRGPGRPPKPKPVTPPVVPPVTPPVIPPVVPPVTPPVIPPVVPPKRGPGRPPKPKPVAPPPAPKPTSPPKLPKATPSAPKLPKTPKLPTTPVGAAPSPQSRRRRQTALGKQSDINPYRFYDPDFKRYVIDYGRWEDAFMPRIMELRQIDADTDVLRLQRKPLRDEIFNLEFGPKKGTNPKRLIELKLQDEDINNRLFALRTGVDAKRSALNTDIRESFKAHTPLSTKNYTIKGTADDVDDARQTMARFSKMIEDRPLKDVDITIMKTSKGNANGWHQSNFYRTANSEIHSVRESPRTLVHEFTHHLDAFTDLYDKKIKNPAHQPKRAGGGAKPWGLAFDACGETTTAINATRKVTKEWHGSGYSGWNNITRDYGGHIYNMENDPFYGGPHGYEMPTTAMEILWDTPVDLWLKEDIAAHQVGQYMLEFIL